MQTEKEIWKSILGHMDYYEVSNFGRIRSLDREIINSLGRLRIYKGKIRKLKIESDGHRIGLGEKSKQLHYWVHRLVAIAFIDNPKNKECVFHKDYNVYNNHVCNLMWTTRNEIKEIARYAQSLSGKIKQLNNHRSKKVKLKMPYGTIKEYVSQSEAARVNNLNLQSLHHAIHQTYGYNKAGKLEVIL